MNDRQEAFRAEKQHLADTQAFIRQELGRQEQHLTRRRQSLMEARRDMYENTVHFSNDFARMTEINQHLTELNSQTNTYGHTEKQVARLGRMLEAPYFARFDFHETGSRVPEAIYLGIATLMDNEDFTIHVYDWRAPIAGIFYRYEPGPAEYQAPEGTVHGEMLLKRQFKIRSGELQYFFDCAVQIRDEMLQEALGRNASRKMRTIVETIQREQDLIIRDTESDVLMVQGAAGSGKTSIALHRVAFLMYEGLSARLDANSILILSPNGVFERYIAGVLPDLGEEAVRQVTLEEMLSLAIGGISLQGARNRQTEAMLSAHEPRHPGWVAYKGSADYLTLMNRLLQHAERKLLQFEDIHYGGVTLFTGAALKNEFLSNKAGIPMARRLKRIEGRVLERMKPLHRKRLRVLEELVEKGGEHPFEIRSYARLLAMKESKAFTDRLRRMTELDCRRLYLRLFSDKALFGQLTQGLRQPEEPEAFRRHTLEALEAGHLPYEDAAAVAWLTVQVTGNSHYADIRQIVIDEAQDYGALHFALFDSLLPEARFTVIGDFNQTLGAPVFADHSAAMALALNRPRTRLLTLERSYRSTLEITAFAQQVLGSSMPTAVFERHGQTPGLHRFPTETAMADALLSDSRQRLQEGCGSAVMLCRTARQARRLHEFLGSQPDVQLILSDEQEMEAPLLIMPVYLAKGLEFDAVLVAGADAAYHTEQDRRLLYIACTRALHRLDLYTWQPWSPLLQTLQNEVATDNTD